MRRVWVATQFVGHDDFRQIVTYNPEAIIRFLIVYPGAHVSQWELPEPSGGGEPEMVGP